MNTLVYQAPLVSDRFVAPRERALRRRVGLIWALLFLNVMTYAPGGLIINLPSKVGKGITQGALWLALLLAMSVNRRWRLRLNAFLIVCTLLAMISLVVSLQTFHMGTSYRAVRLIGFLATLWLLTPWFGRRDLFLLRCHLRCLVGIMMMALVGAAISPSKGFQQGRLSSDIWPVVWTQLAHYGAVAAGLAAVLWLTGIWRRNAALALIALGVLVALLTHTRTDLIAALVGILVASASLFLARRRVRKALAIGLLVALIGTTLAFPVVDHWFLRGESSTEFSDLTGRTVVWHQLLNAPRSKVEMLFGEGLSNTAFNGRSIDNSWLAAYQDQGLVGDAVIGLFLLALLIEAIIRPRGPSRALALFLITFVLISSYTQVGLGDVSPYLMDLTIAATLLMPPARRQIEQPSFGR